MNCYFDIICIGTGISGLYLGYKSINSNKRILFIEKENDIGGRIVSVNTNTSSYYAEGCATRFFKTDNNVPSLENDYYVTKLLDELKIESTPMSNFNLKTDDYYIEVIDQIKKNYPNIDNKYALESFPVIVELLGYSSRKFSDSIGYPVFMEPMNLNMALRSLFKFAGEYQYLIIGGYKSVCENLFNIIKNKFYFKFNEAVTSISFKNNLYCVNNKYFAKKIVFTGTINQLNNIILNVNHLYTLKTLLNYYFDYRAIRVYVKISDPWWNESELFSKWNTGTALNQVIYYNVDTILIYSNMYSADILYNLIPHSYRKINNFININKVPKLKDYLIFHLSIILEHNINISKIWYNYRRDACQFIKPVDIDYDKFFDTIQENNNFFMLSGDYTFNPGWVNSCLEIVEKKYKKILN